MGGPVWPGEPFIVGEEGPELVTLGTFRPRDAHRADGDERED